MYMSAPTARCHSMDPYSEKRARHTLRQGMRLHADRSCGAVHGAAAGERANGGAYAACGSGSLIGFTGRKLAAQNGAACAANGHDCAGAAAGAPNERQPDLGAPCAWSWSEVLQCHAWLGGRLLCSC